MNALIPLLSLLTAAGPLATSGPVGDGTEATVPIVEAVRFEVDYSALLAEQMAAAAEDSAFFVEQDGAKALSDRHGIDVVEDDAAPAIIVKLAWKDYEHSVYRIEIGVERAGEALEPAETFEATCINNSALTAAVVDKLPVALSKLAPPQPDTFEPEEQEPVVEEGTSDPRESEAADRPQRRPLGIKGKLGIGFVAAGAAGLISGGVVYAQGRRYDNNDPEHADWEGRNFRPPGVALMVTGGVLLATGAVLVALDRVQGRRSAKASAWLVPTPRGVALSGRF